MTFFCSLFERLFNVEFNGVFLFGISFFVLEILTFLYYANWQHDGVMLWTTLLLEILPTRLLSDFEKSVFSGTLI